MGRRTGLLGGRALLLAALGASGCALVFDYGDYGDTTGAGGTTGTAGEGGTGGAGAAGGSTQAGGATSTGGTTSTGGGGSGAMGGGGTGGTGGCAPSEEIPFNDVDEDCDGVASGQHLWHRRFGDLDEQAFSDVAIDGGGNILLTGWYKGTLDIGGGHKLDPPAGSDPDMFLAKLTTGGDPVWIRSGGGAATPRQSHGVATDGDGNAFVAGHFVDTAQGPDPRGFVRQVLADGGQGWMNDLPGASVSACTATGTDVAGLVYVTGNFRGTIDFTDAPRTSTGGGLKDDVFVARYDADGALMWSQSFGGDEPDAAWAIAVSAAGESFVTGEYRGTPAGLDPAGNAGDPGRSAIFAMKLSPGGGVLWKKGFPAATLTDGRSRGTAIAIDKEGSVWITGAMHGDAKIGPADPLLHGGGADLFVAKLDPGLGTPLFARSFGDSEDQMGTSVAISDDGSVFVTGVFSGTMDLDPAGPGGELSAQGGQDLFVLKLDSSGKHVWSARLSQSDPPGARDLGLATHGDHVVLAGGWVGALEYGSGKISLPLGGLDVFAVKLSR